MKRSIPGLVAVAAATACGLGSAALPVTGASAASSPVKIALITSLSGVASPQYQTAAQGFLGAVDAQNAAGGVNGHKITTEVFDDQSSPATVVTAVQEAISDGVIGIVSDSSLFFIAAKYAQQAGIPVTGGSFDGPEWGTQPYTNMFASDTGSVNPTFPINSAYGKFLKSHGATNLGTFGYGISPQSTYATYNAAKSAKLAKLKVGVADTSVVYGSNNFSTQALAAKSAGIDSLIANMDNNSNFALLTAIKQAGVKLKVAEFPAGFDQSLVNSNVWSTLQGAYFGSEFRLFQVPHNAGVTAMQSAMIKYEGWTKSQYPTFGQYESYLGAQLMMKGIGLAGSSLMPKNIITSLRNKVTAWNGNGLLAITVNYKTIFGKFVSPSCQWYVQAQPSGFVPVSATPSCAPYVPGTTTKTP